MDRSIRKPGPSNGLKCIPHRIHCSVTPDSGGFSDELERMQVEHFLNTLARIALAVATREIGKDGK
jgi:hypothetical protein